MFNFVFVLYTFFGVFPQKATNHILGFKLEHLQSDISRWTQSWSFSEIFSRGNVFVQKKKRGDAVCQSCRGRIFILICLAATFLSNRRERMQCRRVVVGASRKFGLIPAWVATTRCFPNYALRQYKTNTFYDLEKYTLGFGQIHPMIWKNTLWDLGKYILGFSQIRLIPNYVAMGALGWTIFMASCLLLVVCRPKQGELNRRLLQMLKVVLILWELHLNCTALCILVFECRQIWNTNTSLGRNTNWIQIEILKSVSSVNNEIFCNPYFWPKAPNLILAESPQPYSGRRPRTIHGLDVY